MTQQLVVLRALGLGDLLTGVPAYRALHRAFPTHRRVLAAPEELEPIVRLCGDFDEIVDTRGLQPLDDRFQHVDVAVNLHGCGPHSHRVIESLRPKRTIAFANGAIPGSLGSPRWNAQEHEVTRWCRLLSESGVDADPTDLDIAAPPVPAGTQRAVILHAGAASESRRWPVMKWIELARRLAGSGIQPLLTGNAREFRRARRIAKGAKLPIGCVIAGRTRLDQLAALVAGARAVVCGDTGVAHLASALRTPSVLLFGPTSPTAWGPPQERSYHRVLWQGTSGDPHGAGVDPGLASIHVSSVYAELMDVLALRA